MVVTCSEEAKTALNQISWGMEKGATPVHTIEAFWPMQPCPIKVELALERPLSLLEKYTLRCFNEISGVSAAEIAIKLGLKEPELIQETLDALIRAGAIETSKSTSNASNADLLALKEDRELLESKLNSNVYKGVVRLHMEGKLRLLDAQIEQLENPKHLSFREKITAQLKRLLGFKAKVTAEGKEQLSRGKIVEPTHTQIFELVRCLGTNSLHQSRTGGALSIHHLQAPSSGAWMPLETSTRKPSQPVKNEVQKTLQAEGAVEGVNIFSIEPVLEKPEVKLLPICITLAVSHEDHRPLFFVHRKGVHSPPRLKWIEAFLKESKEAESWLLKRFEEEMAIKTKVNTFAKPHEIEPLVSAASHIKRFASSDSKSMMLLHQQKSLLKELGCAEDEDVLVANRTTVEYPNNLKKAKIAPAENVNTLKISIPVADSGVPEYSIVSQEFMLQLVNVSVKSRHQKNLEAVLPAVVFNQEKGNILLSEANTYLRQKVQNPKDRYLFTRSITDFVEWLRQGMADLKTVANVSSFYADAKELSKGSTFDLFQLFMDVLFEERMDLFEGDMGKAIDQFLAGLASIEEFDHAWPLFEPKLQQSILQSVLKGGSNQALADAWQAHSSGTKQLAWEDAARLEHAWVGHCDATKFRASRFFEETVLELAGSKELTTESVAKALDALKQKSLITEDLYDRADRVRKDRNAFTHTAGLSAELDYTLRLISVMRELSALGQAPKSGSWAQEKGTEWISVLTLPELEAYVEKVTKVLENKARSPSSGHVWVVSLLQSLPSKLEEPPLGLLKLLSKAPKVDAGPQFSDVLSSILKNGMTAWVNHWNASSQFDIPQSMGAVLILLEEAGMTDELNQLKKAYLGALNPLKSYEELEVELKVAGDSKSPFLSDDFSIRWKRSIKDRSFLVSFNDLASMSAQQFEALTNDVKDELFTQAVRCELKGIAAGDVVAVKSLCDALQSFTGKDQLWNKSASRKDGFVGSEMGNKIRASGNLIEMGAMVSNLMPFVDKERFPKVDARLEEIIDRGKKEAKKVGAKKE